MAAQVAKDSNTLESIRDVSELYDRYYSSIKSDLNALKNGDVLKVAGIVAFFRNIDRTNDSLMSDIKRIFGISVEDFWEASKTLHDMEVLDMFENEVVKISDQVLSTYLFYLVFFKEKLIDFSILINYLFPQYKQRLIDAINPILNTFNFNEIKKIMELAVNDAWDVIQKRNESDFLQLIDVFWFLKPTETLIFIQDKINNIKRRSIILDEVDFEAESSSSSPEFLSILSHFRNLEEDMVKFSLDLFLEYAEKQPHNTPTILYYLVDIYGFNLNSYIHGYYVQHIVIDKLIKHTDSGNNEYFTRLFIALAKKYMHTNFSNTKSGKANTITLTQFDLVASEDLFKLRKKVLNYLFSLYKNNKYQQYIQRLLLSHTRAGLNITINDITKYDLKLMSSFFASGVLNSNDLYYYILVQEYLKLSKRFNISIEEELNLQFQSPSYVLYDLFTNKFKSVELQKKKIAELTTSFSKEDYDKIFYDFFNVFKIINEPFKLQIDQGILSILEELANRNPDLLCEVISHYLEQGDYLEINPWPVVSNLLSIFDTTKVFAVLNTPEYPSKNRWLFNYYKHLPIADIQLEHINRLYDLYKISEYKYFIKDIDYLLKYESIEKGFVANVVRIILERINTNPEFAYLLSLIFSPHTEINKKLNSVFFGKFTLLEDVYIAVDRVDQYVDHNGSSLSILLDNDYAFIDKYLKNKFSRKNYLSRHDDSRDYSFVWLRDDYVDIMQRITSFVFEHERKSLYFSYYETFFKKNVNPQTDNSILEKQNKYLFKEIETESDKNEYMRFLFSVIASFPLQRKLIFYKAFLDKNKEFNDFKNIPFESTISSWSGSAVPMLQGKIDFYEEIIKICNSVALLKHRQFIEQIIKGIRDQIQHEKKRDFTKA